MIEIVYTSQALMNIFLLILLVLCHKAPGCMAEARLGSGPGLLPPCCYSNAPVSPDMALGRCSLIPKSELIRVQCFPY